MAAVQFMLVAVLLVLVALVAVVLVGPRAGPEL